MMTRARFWFLGTGNCYKDSDQMSKEAVVPKEYCLWPKTYWSIDILMIHFCEILDQKSNSTQLRGCNITTWPATQVSFSLCILCCATISDSTLDFDVEELAVTLQYLPLALLCLHPFGDAGWILTYHCCYTWLLLTNCFYLLRPTCLSGYHQPTDCTWLYAGVNLPYFWT